MHGPILRDDQAAGPAPEVWSREGAIERLRVGLLKLSDGEHSMCQVAAERGIFCRGFRRWHDREFHRRFRPFIGASTHLTRPQMEAFADIWQLSEQLHHDVALPCDAASISPGACRGWDELSDADLEISCRELLGKAVTVGGRRDTVRGQTTLMDQSRQGLDVSRIFA